ncbi:hypothetical protein ACWIEX_11110 [Bosea sp. NPDC055353]
MTFERNGDGDLERAASRAARSTAPLIATLVKSWRKAFPSGQPEIELGCRMQNLSELSLCLRPRTESWMADVEEIAGSLDIDKARLAIFLRTAEAIERLGDAHPTENAAVGMLLAARDRDEEE